MTVSTKDKRRNDSSSLFVLYKVSNWASDSNDDGRYNAFRMSFNDKDTDTVTLKSVKRDCHALQLLTPFGPDGFHWRLLCMQVLEEDRTSRGSTDENSNSSPCWLDVMDENISLPVEEMTPKELNRTLHSKSSYTTDNGSSHGHAAAAVAKAGWQKLGHVFHAMIDSESSSSSITNDHPVNVIVFKLLDLSKISLIG